MKNVKKNTQRGSVPLIEAAITVPVLLIIIFTFIQLVLYVNAKITTKYAAFCAARAGIVYGANPTLMRKAACIALAPLFSEDQKKGYKIAFGTTGKDAQGQDQGNPVYNPDDIVNVITLVGGYAQDSAANVNRKMRRPIGSGITDASGFIRSDRFFPMMKKYSEGMDFENAIDTTRLMAMVIFRFPVTMPIVSSWIKELPIHETWVMRMQTDGYVDKAKEELIVNLLQLIDSYAK